MFSQTDGMSHTQIRTAKLVSTGQDSSVLCVAGGGCFCLVTCCPSDGHLGGFLFGAMGIGLPIRTPNRGHLWCPCSVGEAVVSVLLALPPRSAKLLPNPLCRRPCLEGPFLAVQGLHRITACLPPSPSFQLFARNSQVPDTFPALSQTLDFRLSVVYGLFIPG